MTAHIDDAVRHIRAQDPTDYPLGIILGSGLGALADSLAHPRRLSYRDIPHFPTSSVAGHSGTLVLGQLAGRPTAVMQGRVHYYEGYSPEDVVLPVRVLYRLGVRTLIVTNAAGGVNPEFNPGDIMLIRDHVNFMGFNPLRGRQAVEFGPRFPDMSQAYSPELADVARDAARDIELPLREGVYLAVSGPSYETPAEIRMFRHWGADAVGMSTVPEAIAAAQSGMRVLGLSCITNMAAGIQAHPLNHEEVIETTNRVREQFVKLLNRILERVTT